MANPNALTLIAAAQSETIKPLEKGVMFAFAEDSSLLRVLPFEPAPGGAVVYSKESSLPSIAWRAVGGTYSKSYGMLSPEVESCKILGGEATIDTVTEWIKGAGVLQNQLRMKIKAMAAAFTTAFFKGDGIADPTSLTGLQARINTSGPQCFSAGSTGGGAALSLSLIDEAIDSVTDPSIIIGGLWLGRAFDKAARTTTLSGYISYQPDEFGRKVRYYRGLPVLTVTGPRGNDDTVLPFTEAAASGAATATSAYICAFGPGKLIGLHVPPPDAAQAARSGGFGIKVTRLQGAGGEMESAPSKGVRVEALLGLANYNGQSAARIRHIGKLDLVA